MNRVALSVAILLLSLRATAFGEEAAFDIVDLTCFADGTFVAVTSDLQLVMLKEQHWQPFSASKGVLRLWRSPDDRIFALERNNPSFALEVLRGPRPGMRWKLPSDSGWLRFASLNGVDVVTPDRIYRLDPGGELTDLGKTPIGGSGQRLRDRAPEILVSGRTAVVCTGTSEHEEDYVGGSCREAHGAYLYLVAFGDPGCCAFEAAHFANPFVCGGVVISTVRDWRDKPMRDVTQARALVTGARLGRREGAARLGSTCLDGKRALLVGKRDIQIVSVPGLRRLWRQKIASKIGAVAVCGGVKAAVIPEWSSSPPEEFDLPPPETHGRKETPPASHVAP